MRLIDMHCDTISLMMRQERLTNLRKNTWCVDLEKMKQADSMAQFFASFIYMQEFQGENRYTKAYAYALQMLARTKQEFAEHADRIALALSYEDLQNHHAAGKISGFLTVEEGGILDGSLKRVEELYQEGVRLLTLTWNGENCIGYPNSRDEQVMNWGLKPFGFQVVERMNELGMIVDVSHLSDGGFWDVVRHSKKPVVASHSNARALCPHPRNLTDEMIRALAENGGIAGINFYPWFLNGSANAAICDIIRHMTHMYHVGGEEVVAIGTDFDGFDDGVNEISDIGQMPLLYEAVKKQGFTERQIEKFWCGNAMRIIKENLR